MLNNVVNSFWINDFIDFFDVIFGGDVLEVGLDDDADIDIVLDVDNDDILSYWYFSLVDLKVWSISTLSLASKQCLGELWDNRKNQNPKEVKLRHNNFPDLKLKLSQD